MATIVSSASYIQAVLDYSFSRTDSGVYLNYSLYLKRLNGYQSYGTIAYNVAINGSSIKSGSGIKLTVPGNSTAYVFSGATHTVSVGAFDSGSFTLSFSTSGDISNFNHSGSATISYSAYVTGVGTPTVSITDNGNNTFSISASAGSSGTNNAATGVSGIGYSFDNSNWISGSSGSVTIDRTVYARAFTVGTYNNSGYASTSKSVKYYSKPGKPTVMISDNGSGIVTISVTKGSNGSNNAATGVSDVQYSFNNSTWTNYSSSFTVTSSQTVYARARTKGTYTGNNNAYLYSEYAVVSSLVTAVTKCGKPNLSLSSSMLKYSDNNLILFINAESGVNNDITGYEIQYSASDTLTFINWSNSSSITTTADVYDFEFDSIESYFNTLKSLNKKYICFKVKTIGSASGYDSDYNYISIMTDKGYPRFKNSEGVYETCIPYISKEGIWSQCVLNSSVLSKLKDSSGECIFDSNGENIYTLEDSNVILNN